MNKVKIHFRNTDQYGKAMLLAGVSAGQTGCDVEVTDSKKNLFVGGASMYIIFEGVKSFTAAEQFKTYLTAHNIEIVG